MFGSVWELCFMKHIVLCRGSYFTNCHNAETSEVSFVSFKFAFLFRNTGIILCIVVPQVRFVERYHLSAADIWVNELLAFEFGRTQTGHSYAPNTGHYDSHTNCLSSMTCSCFRGLILTGQLKCDGTHAETRFRLSAKGTSPFKYAGASVQSTTGSRGVRISGSNAGHAMFQDSVKGTGYLLYSPVSPSLPLPCIIVCHHVSTGVY